MKRSEMSVASTALFCADCYDGRERGDGVWVAFSPTQIKSATGNTGAFNPDTPDIRFRLPGVTLDAECLAAVERGDMETAQRMVDEIELRRLQPEWAHIPSAEMPNSRFRTAAQIDEPTLERIASQYERMADRAGIEPTDLRFHVEQGNAVVWSPYQSNDYVVGQFIGDVFAISHFAPETQRSGLLALQDLLHTATPVVFAVPDKLASQLSRIGFKESRVIVPMMFRGEVQRKHVLVNHAFKEQHLRDLLSWYSIEIRSRGLTSSVAADAKMLPADAVEVARRRISDTQNTVVHRVAFP